MKKAFYSATLAAALLVLGACNETSDKNIDTSDVRNPHSASENGGEEAMGAMEFEEKVFDFGSITQGEKVTKKFAFKNTGEADLVIVSAKGSCGCTVPEWPKEPIAPGGSGVIDVVFNSDGKSGIQNKKVSIVANTNPSTTVLTLKGEVIAPETGEATAE